MPVLSGALQGLIGAGASIINNERNIQMQKEINAQNLQNATELQEKAWERDDNAFQRAVADAEKAGFSPLAVLQGGTSGNTVNNPYQAQSPTSDITGLITSLISASQINQKQQEINLNKENSQANTETTKKQLELQEKELNSNLTFKNKELEIMAQNQTSQIEQFKKTMALQTQQLQQAIKQNEHENMKDVSEKTYREYQMFSEQYGVNPRSQKFTNFNEYCKAVENYNDKIIKFNKIIKEELKETYNSYSKATSASGSGSVGVAMVKTSGSGSSSNSESYSMDTQIKTIIAQKLDECGIVFPLYLPKTWEDDEEE